MPEVIEFFYHNIIDLKGHFAFDFVGFEFFSFWSKQYINYEDLVGVSRVYYDRTKSVVNITVNEANPNKYCIKLKNGKKLEFCVAHREEDAYIKSITQLKRRIYGFNSLGVHLTAKVKAVDAKTRHLQAKEFERLKPQHEYSLEKAIAALLRHCAMELDDQTEYRGPQDLNL